MKHAPLFCRSRSTSAAAVAATLVMLCWALPFRVRSSEREGTPPPPPSRRPVRRMSRPAAAPLDIPMWRKGTSWIVCVRYRKSRLYPANASGRLEGVLESDPAAPFRADRDSSASGRDVWTRPVYWLFRVMSVEKARVSTAAGRCEGGVLACRVCALGLGLARRWKRRAERLAARYRRADGTLRARRDRRAVLELLRRGPVPRDEVVFLVRPGPDGKRIRDMRLASAAFWNDLVSSAGRVRRRRDPLQVDFTGMSDASFPVLAARYSAVPWDFPLLAEGGLVGAEGAGVVCEVTEGREGLFFPMDVLQRVRPLSEERVLPLMDERLASALGGRAERFLGVSFFRPSDGDRCRQVWCDGVPWWIYSEGRNYRARLVKFDL